MRDWDEGLLCSGRGRAYDGYVARFSSLGREESVNISTEKKTIVNNRQSKRGLKMIGVEIDMVTSDSLKALELYEKMFDIKRVEVTNFPRGQNEVVFTLYDVRFHMLDENPTFGLIAPGPDGNKSVWFNIMVPDIKETFSKAITAGCTQIQPVTELPDFGVSNAIFKDTFGYVWLLHQMHKEVSFEERVRLFEEKKGN